MNKIIIKKLSSNLINQIAAGEVVDNPSSIVKELIENSLDANASSIKISLYDGGLNRIIIKDNGEGMGPEDLKNAFDRFTTSKINNINDLYNINTLGFRGEALASISSVANVKIKSKHNNFKNASELFIEYGKIIYSKPAAFSEGTYIEIKNIFNNIPARKKFLKTSNIEYRNCIKVIKTYALSNNNVQFDFLHNDKLIFSLPKCTLYERIINVLGKKFKDNLIKIDFEKDDIHISGYIGTLSNLQRRRGNQFTYVNNRYVLNKLINLTVYNCYRNLLERGEFPFYLIKIKYPTKDIDVNVHPKKMEIKFKNEHKLQFVVQKCISQKIKNIIKMIPKIQYNNSDVNIYENQNIELAFSNINDNTNNKYFPIETAEKRIQTYNNNDEDITFDKKIWQIHNKYIITELKSGIIIIDQHVAHERILYESAKNALENDGMDPQSILFPLTLKFENEEFLSLKEIIPYLEKIGFEIRIFGHNSIIIEGIPPELTLGNEKEIISNILDNYIANHQFNSSFIEYMAATYACKAAIKAGDKLSFSECAELIDKLFNTKYPYYCPHGRPIIINLTIDELDKRFERH